ncbi:MAG: S8 family serine peptidase, partial [Bacteroidia bacterium]
TRTARVAAQLQGAGVRGDLTSLPQLLQLPGTGTARLQAMRALGAKTATKATKATKATTKATVPQNVELLKFAKRLQATGGFAYVQPNWIVQRHASVGEFPPDDRGHDYQRWHYEQINLPSAMSRINALTTQPAQRPLVAVIDDGVVLDHPDLAPQLFSPGRAFISRNTAGDGNLPSGDNTATAADQPIFHGTHVAGTVAAATFDGIGGAGSAPMALILPLRVFPAQGGATSVDIINAMLYAARLSNNSGQLPARRADVINMSLGGDRACDAAYQDAINQVRNAGVIVVVAAGNSGHNDRGQRAPVGAPANCQGAIAVSALDAKKQLTPYANTGAEIAVAAPGGDAGQSTTGTGAPDNVYSDLAAFDANGARQPAFGGMQGTSMAAPHVAGVMALMRYVNPGLTVAQVDQLLQQGALTDELGTAGRDIDFGFGLVNARKAVNAALAAAGNPPPAPAGQVMAGPSSIDFGSFQSSATLDLAVTAATNETVVAITPDHAAVTLTATNVDPATKLGRYTVNVNRALLAPGSVFPKLMVTTSTARTLTVQLSITQPAGGGTTTNADYGPIYVLLVDPDTQQVERTVLAQRSGGQYTWTASNYTRPRVAVIAGADLDNDDLVCQRGEPCGAFPVLAPGRDLTAITLGGNRSSIDFQVAPLSGMSVQGGVVDSGGAGRIRVNEQIGFLRR